MWPGGTRGEKVKQIGCNSWNRSVVCLVYLCKQFMLYFVNTENLDDGHSWGKALAVTLPLVLGYKFPVFVPFSHKHFPLAIISYYILLFFNIIFFLQEGGHTIQTVLQYFLFPPSHPLALWEPSVYSLHLRVCFCFI